MSTPVILKQLIKPGTTFSRPSPTRLIKELKGVIIHWTANLHPGADAVANRNYYQNLPAINRREGRQVFASAHFNVDDEKIVQCIPEEEFAYHVGAKSYTEFAKKEICIHTDGKFYSPNYFLIGIELCVNKGARFDITRRKGAHLAQYLLKKHGLGLNNLYTHWHITGKYCPQNIIKCPSGVAQTPRGIDADDGEDFEQFRREVSAFFPIEDLNRPAPMLMGSASPMGSAALGDGEVAPPVSPLRCEARLIRMVSAFGRTDGIGEVRIAGGRPPYQIYWANGERGERAVRLGGGLHRVTIQDADFNITAAEIFALEPFPGLNRPPVPPNFAGGLLQKYGLGGNNQAFPLRPI